MDQFVILNKKSFFDCNTVYAQGNNFIDRILRTHSMELFLAILLYVLGTYIVSALLYIVSALSIKNINEVPFTVSQFWYA